MLSPKEKAEELVEAFMNIKKQKLSDYSIIYHPTAKQCALIAVNEILDAINEWDHYWEQVKQEIEQL
jgi:hypothetical protein